MPDTMPTDMQVAEGCYMIGRRNPDYVLQCNTYLRTFHGGGADFHWCVDPGSMMDYSVIRTNLLHRLGDMVPTPFCHFRGAVAFYDPESQILFSGDLFGGLNSPGRTHLYAQEDDWAGIAQFHQIYMPTREVVARSLRLIRALDPPVQIIAPQHGFVLTGDYMHEVMDRLEQLPMGIDLFPDELDERHHKKYAEVFQEVLGKISHLLGASEVRSLLLHLPHDHELADYIRIIGDEVHWRQLPIGRNPTTRVWSTTCGMAGCAEYCCGTSGSRWMPPGS